MIGFSYIIVGDFLVGFDTVVKGCFMVGFDHDIIEKCFLVDLVTSLWRDDLWSSFVASL